MATTTLTHYLKLKVDSDLTANSKYNLNRIDDLGGAISVDSSNNLSVRSAADLTIEPNSPDLDGSGVGGTVNIGTSEHHIAVLNLFADSIVLVGSLSALTIDSLVPDTALFADSSKEITSSVTTSTELSYVSGARSNIQDQIDAIVSGSDTVLAAATDWVMGDGATKIFAHGLLSTDVNVTVIDSTSHEIIGVDSIVVVDSNTIMLSSSEAPFSSWRVVVQAKA